MEFDVAAGEAHGASDEATNFEVAKNAFEEAGYNLPRIVFWNLAFHDRDDRTASTPVTTKVCGLASIFYVVPLKLICLNLRNSGMTCDRLQQQGTHHVCTCQPPS